MSRGPSSCGQTLAEYLVALVVLVAVTLGMVRLFGAAWKAKFTKVSATRAGAAGVAP